MNELAYYIKKCKQLEKQVDYLKFVNKKQEKEIQELSILLHKKIRFMKEMRDRNGIMDKNTK